MTTLLFNTDPELADLLSPSGRMELGPKNPFNPNPNKCAKAEQPKYPQIHPAE